MKKNEGITLIALIITIIILIILTAITINNVIGTDLIGFATKAAENYTDAEKKEGEDIDKIVGTLDNQGVSDDSIVRAGQTVTADTGKETDGKITYNYTDAQRRHAMVPEGFKVSTKVSEQFVEDGLVIQDNDGNEFVWVPCYYGTKPDGTADDVQAYTKHIYDGTAINRNDQPRALQDTGNGNWWTFCYTIYGDSWQDTAPEEYGNTSVEKYGGFYIGRYEAGLPEEWQPNLNEEKPAYSGEERNNNSDNVLPISKANMFSWNYINQPNAKKASENMYKDGKDSKNNNVGVTSHLVDGTAWDTITSWIEANGVDVNHSSSYGNCADTKKLTQDGMQNTYGQDYKSKQDIF